MTHSNAILSYLESQGMDTNNLKEISKFILDQVETSREINKLTGGFMSVSYLENELLLARVENFAIILSCADRL